MAKGSGVGLMVYRASNQVDSRLIILVWDVSGSVSGSVSDASADLIGLSREGAIAAPPKSAIASFLPGFLVSPRSFVDFRLTRSLFF